MIAKLVIATLLIGTVISIDNGLGLLPPMGWSTWCTDDIIECYDDFCNEQEIKQIAQAMVSNGMRDLGYNYVNLDDCWAGPRDQNGNLTGDPSRFPSGMKALADYLHSLDLKLGLYTCAGNVTCRGNRPGSWGHFQQDAYTFANWGVDQIKMDWCDHPSIAPNIVYGMMRDALNKTGKPIFFSICEWGKDEPWTWGAQTGNAWRIGLDHLPFWWLPDTKQGVIDGINNLAYKSKYSGPGGWNDADFLMTGAITMTDIDSTTEFSFWSLCATPLIVSTGKNVSSIFSHIIDIRDMSNKAHILLNAEVIAVNQDKLAVAGDIIANNSDGSQLWAKPLADGSFAAILFNPNFWDSLNITISWQQLWPNAPEGTVCTVRDLWAHQDLGSFTDTFSSVVEGHGVTMIKVVKQSEDIISI